MSPSFTLLLFSFFFLLIFPMMLQERELSLLTKFFSKENKIIKTCEKSCSICEDKGKGICKVCSEGYYKKYDNNSSKECYNEDTIPKNFFLDTTDRVYKECDKSCKSCSENPFNCLENPNDSQKKFKGTQRKNLNGKKVRPNFKFFFLQILLP